MGYFTEMVCSELFGSVLLLFGPFYNTCINTHYKLIKLLHVYVENANSHILAVH